MRLRAYPLVPSMGKRYGKHKKKAPATAPLQDGDTWSATMLPPYNILRTNDTPKIRITNNARFPLVSYSVPTRVRVMHSIHPNLKKMIFVDHDRWKFPDLEMDKYMVTVKDTKNGPMHLVPMVSARGFDKVCLVSLMCMLHFGRSTEVNACVKQLLV